MWRVGWAVRVPPQKSSSDEEQQRKNRKLLTSDSLLCAFTVEPGKRQDNRQADRETEHRELLDEAWPAEGVRSETEDL